MTSPNSQVTALLAIIQLNILIQKQINLTTPFYLTIRLRARDFYAVIVDEGEARINYHRIEIESE